MDFHVNLHSDRWFDSERFASIMIRESKWFHGPPGFSYGRP